MFLFNNGDNRIFLLDNETKDRLSEGEKQLARKKALEDPTYFRKLCFQQKILPAVNSLIPIGNWITPKQYKKRFDTHFFFHSRSHKDSCRFESHTCISNNEESISLDWYSPQEALEDYSQGKIRLFPPQWFILKEMSSFLSLKELEELYLPWAYQHAVPILPEFHKHQDGETVALLTGDGDHSWSDEKSNSKRRLKVIFDSQKNIVNMELDANVFIPPLSSNIKSKL